MSSQSAPSLSPLPVAVLISGGGTTLKNLIDLHQQGLLEIDIRLVISSRSNVKGLAFAEAAKIPTLIMPRKKFSDDANYRDAIFNACREAGAPCVVMGGFLQHVLIPEDYTNRVINIHPSLIPSFCGKGFYGLHVHQAAIEYGVKVSGCTVHFVDNQYDHGPVILQRTCEVKDDDTPESLQARVFQLECQALPAALRAIASGTLRVSEDGRRVVGS